RGVGVDNENIVIAPAILEAIKSSMAGYTAEELITKRAEVSNQIQSTLMDKISGRGFTITEFNITNIDFSEQYDQAIEAKAVKQQEVVTAQAELEKQQIQNEKEISIAEKDAKVMELQNSQITENTLKLKELEIQQEMVERWDGVLPSTVVGEDFSGLLNVGQ
ncbi:MAG: prohibitin family protein, partial [Clostridia bacterium]|nr:prohibitin family protein [Clostridia bacterium]